MKCERQRGRDRSGELAGGRKTTVVERERERMNFFDLNILSHTLFIPEENVPHIEHDVQLYLYLVIVYCSSSQLQTLLSVTLQLALALIPL